MPSDMTFAYDLAEDEARRRTAVLAAIGDDWDPVQILADEELAHRMLYTGLDDTQQEVHRMLVDAGVLPPRGADHAAD